MPCGKKKQRKPFDDVEEDAQNYTKQFFKTKKILLLGTGESGKTTIIKQMKILHINGFSNDERKAKIPFIKQNIHESIYDILFNMDKINPPVELRSEESKKSAEYILSLGPKEPATYPQYTDEYFDHVKTAWADIGVQETFVRSNEYQLIDSAEHFLNKIDDVRQPDYIPTTQDILICRIMTVSISTIEFEIPVPLKYGGGTAQFCMYDVGGQRGERKKWIRVFEGIEAILFLVAASDFDQKLREDESKNRLQEAFDLFQDVYTSRFVRKAGLIVFLNKQDLLQKKIERGQKLQEYFPQFTNYRLSEKSGNVTDYERARLFIRQKIMDIAVPLKVEQIGFIPGHNIEEELPPRDVYIHFTIATDTNNIKRVFESVQEIILMSTIRDTFSL